MILLDTNVLSEGLRPRPDRSVQQWLDAQPPAELFLCTPVLAELHYGAALLPKGARRTQLEKIIASVEQAFADRTIAFDADAAAEYGRIVAQREELGRPIGTMDGLIAAIASVHDATVATRDVRGFAGIGLQVVDPFKPAVR